MGDDGILAVDDDGIIPAFVEHSHIHTQNTGEVNSSRHCTFIGADNHQVIVVCSEIGHMSQKRFQKLISREEIVKPFQWNGILHSWVVSVKGNDIGDSHITELFQC